MDLSQYLQSGADTPVDAGQQLSKEEYAAMKKQEREGGSGQRWIPKPRKSSGTGNP